MNEQEKNIITVNQSPSTAETVNTNTVIPVVHETIEVGKKTVETGRFNVVKQVTEESYTANIPLNKEEIIIEKKAINQYVDDNPPGIRLDGDTTIIPVIREVIVKRLLLVEEIHITKRTTQHTASVNETLRKEEVVINRTDSYDHIS
jgi:uncharacterized protein (TIGR02271 family)